MAARYSWLLKSKLKLTVIARKACHLCDEMITELHAYSVGFEVIYLDEQPKLELAYGLKVPVLLQAEKELCHFFLDHDVLEEVLQ